MVHDVKSYHLAVAPCTLCYIRPAKGRPPLRAADLQLPPPDRGFTVERSSEGVDNPGDVPESPEPQQRWWRWPWYEHQNLRDERAEAFSTLPWEGVYTYSYVARATTPGQFVAPPAKAEEMYAPETFGRSASDRVIVE
jgi:uncharacterized protein YfaS (alpha-2-macroglobulin family)